LWRRASPGSKCPRDNPSEFPSPLKLRSDRFPLRALLSHHRASVNGHALWRCKSLVLLGFQAECVKFESNTVVLTFTKVIAEKASVFVAMFILFLFKTTLTD
jgi:hypothetical protein